MKNFAFPFFSRDIAEFWRRWHISLTTWLKDYLYIPLGGSRGGRWMKVRNTFIIFVVCGLWHGANWTFIVFGALHAIYFLPLLLTNKNRNYLEIVAKGKSLPTAKEFLQMSITFGLFVFSLMLFRAENIGHAIRYISGVFSPSLFELPQFAGTGKALLTLILTGLLILIEWQGRENDFAIQHLGVKWKSPFRYATYYAIILAILAFGGKQQQFIYFQF